MPYMIYEEIFKHLAGQLPKDLGMLALKTSEVEVGERLSTEQTTVWGITVIWLFMYDYLMRRQS